MTRRNEHYERSDVTVNKDDDTVIDSPKKTEELLRARMVEAIRRNNTTMAAAFKRGITKGMANHGK